ncbi:hypothetical protein Bbelb_042600 [Branchiostoma belcheri]|nr:hypothetical protein Bbelb_042600 [Branchiostoma belcheri]
MPQNVSGTDAFHPRSKIAPTTDITPNLGTSLVRIVTIWVSWWEHKVNITQPGFKALMSGTSGETYIYRGCEHTVRLWTDPAPLRYYYLSAPPISALTSLWEPQESPFYLLME